MRNRFPMEELHSEQVRDWLLAILRYAVTLEPRDRSAVLSLAQDMDRHGSSEVTSFAFFARMSNEFCAAITNRRDPKRIATLRRHLKRIDDRRLRRTLLAAIDFEPVPLALHPR